MVSVMWEAVRNSGTQDVMITWRGADGKTLVGYVVAEWAPHIYSARVVRSWKGQQVPTNTVDVFADTISFAQYV
jgi:hypothetical protein